MDSLHLRLSDLSKSYQITFNFRLVNLFEVKAVPAVLAFRNGVVVDKFIGLVDANMIEDLINNLQRKKTA
jgi:thioredoxin-like negative regulator of GroEL